MCVPVARAAGETRKEPIHIGEDSGYSKDHFVIPSHYYESIERVLIPHGIIVDRIERLAYDIHSQFKDVSLHVLCILKGSRGFFSQLLMFLNKFHIYGGGLQRSHPPYIEHYVRIKSYSNDESTGALQILSEDLSLLQGQNVLVVEDIVDTGTTLTKFSRWLSEMVHPKSISVASLLEKRTPKGCGFKADFVGFSIPDEFVVGFSLDYNEVFRDLDHLCIVNSVGCNKYRVKADDGSEPKPSKTFTITI